MDADSFDRMMAANVRGPMLQLSTHLKSGASVMVTSSSSTYEGAAATSLYAATKGAIVAMARSWAWPPRWPSLADPTLEMTE